MKKPLPRVALQVLLEHYVRPRAIEQSGAVVSRLQGSGSASQPAVKLHSLLNLSPPWPGLD